MNFKLLLKKKYYFRLSKQKKLSKQLEKMFCSILKMLPLQTLRACNFASVSFNHW